MGFFFRRSKKTGPIRWFLTPRGVSPSVRVGRRRGVTVGRRGVSLRLGKGLGFRFRF